jgi:hypothetical protein
MSQSRLDDLMAETRSSSGGRPAVYGARKKAISVYLPPAWHPRLRRLSAETQMNLSELAVHALAEKYGLSLDPPGRDEQPSLLLDAEDDGGQSSMPAA